jgi:hypothetical protein
MSFRTCFMPEAPFGGLPVAYSAFTYLVLAQHPALQVCWQSGLHVFWLHCLQVFPLGEARAKVPAKTIPATTSHIIFFI